MPLFEAVIPLRYASPLLEFVHEQRPDALADILAAAGLDGMLATTPRSLSASQFDALVCAASHALERNDLGFEIGRRINLDSHDALSFALRACPTADAVMRTITRYSRLVAPLVHLQYKRLPGTGGADYLLRPGAGMCQVALYALEEMFALAVHGDVHALCGTTRGLQIHFSMPRPAHIERYRLLAPTRFVFAASALPEVRCSLPADLLDRPLIGDASKQSPTLLEALRAANSAVDSSDGIKAWVELILLEAEGIQPSLAELAGLLEVSERTFSRLLAAEGCDLRQLGSAIRHRRACELLMSTSLSVEHISQRLGYRSLASFSNAFRNAQGSSPMQYRKGNTAR